MRVREDQTIDIYSFACSLTGSLVRLLDLEKTRWVSCFLDFSSPTTGNTQRVEIMKYIGICCWIVVHHMYLFLCASNIDMV